MPLIDMKRPKKKEDTTAEQPIMVEEKYPWGLRITLDREELDKLSLGVKEFPIGGTCKIEAEADVISVRESERTDRQPERSIELQIKRMAIPNKAGNPGKYHTYDKAQKAGPGEKV